MEGETDGGLKDNGLLQRCYPSSLHPDEACRQSMSAFVRRDVFEEDGMNERIVGEVIKRDPQARSHHSLVSAVVRDLRLMRVTWT